MYPNKEDKIVVPITKKNGDYYEYPSLSPFTGEHQLQRKMVETKACPTNPKHQHRVSQCGEHDCRANNKKNGNNYKYPSLSYSIDEL